MHKNWVTDLDVAKTFPPRKKIFKKPITLSHMKKMETSEKKLTNFNLFSSIQVWSKEWNLNQTLFSLLQELSTDTGSTGWSQEVLQVIIAEEQYHLDA